MGPVGIDIYGSRCHSSSKMIKYLVVPNARCSSTVGHYYLDLVEENGGMYSLVLTPTTFLSLQFSFKPRWMVAQKLESYMQLMSLCGKSQVSFFLAVISPIYRSYHCMPDISIDTAPPFVALPSTDNIPIESSWHLFTNYVGLDIKQIILLGKSLHYFNPGLLLHVYVLNV